MRANLSIKVGKVSGDNQVVSFDGEFDKAGHSEIHEKVAELVNSFEGKNLVFDFTDLKFINSEGIGYLMEIHSHLKGDGKKLVIVGASERILDVFKTIGIGEIISVYKDLKAFTEK